MNPSFIHLKTHSEYSIVDGVLRINSLISSVAAQNMPAVALTDQMNLFALVKFYSKTVSAGIKPIIGADLVLLEKGKTFTVTALCKNQMGYQNLIRLLSRAYLEGQENDKPHIQWSWLVAAKEGLIILSGGRRGDVGQAILRGRNKKAEQRLQRWLEHFPQHYYLELQRTQRDQEEDYIHVAVDLASRFHVPVVATNDVRFLQQDDFEAHEARVCIYQGRVLDDANRPREYSEQQYLKTPEEMAELFADIPEALANTVEIAKRCTVSLTLGEVFLPKFPVPDDITVEDYFKQQARAGLEKRLEKLLQRKQSLQAYQERLESELDVIIKMGFSGYFLIVADFISWAKHENIPVGPGRGSGAGSLVAYSLGITELDPIEHDLLFERFLNPERVSMPDFDIDFCMEGRDRVIDYVADRYGHKAVAQIITYGTMAAKAVVRDVGRVLGMPYGFVDKVAKLIPFELGMTLEKALQQSEELARRYKEDDNVQTLIDLALKLEGVTRNAGKHAGGVVIAPTQLTDFVPLYCEPGGEHVVTQFDKNDVEAVGLVKFDFLGLRTLTIIDWAVKSINQKRALEQLELLDITTIPLDDAPTFQLLKNCATTAVFQLESRGMKELIRQLQPDSFDDIKALVALFRPGPLQSGMVEDFINRKHGRARVDYPHPDLEPILRSTYGVILYQEQVMQIAQVLAGYSLGGADILRSAMGKKKPEEMAKQRVVFIEGAANRGIDTKVAEHIFDLMEKFAGYGFNKSHSSAYALIAYQTAWLKTHYPAEFMAAVLSSDMDNTDKVVGFISECREMNLEVLPPDINKSYYRFTVNDAGKIVYGLGAVKGAGEAAIIHLVENRDKKGLFRGLFDVCHRLDTRKVNRRVLEPLIRSGAMDGFGVSRAQLAASIDKALKSAEQKNRDAELGQDDLFGGMISSNESTSEESYVQAPQWSDSDRLRGEKETLGLYITGHPLESCEKELAHLVSLPIHQLKVTGKNTVTIAGMIISTRSIMTRQNKRMAVLTLEDRSGRIEVTLFSDLYQHVMPELNSDSIFIVKGTVAADDYTGGVRMVADTIISLEKVREQMAKRLLIHVENEAEVDTLLSELPVIIKEHVGGRCPVTISYQGEKAGAELVLGNSWRVKPNGDLLAQLGRLCGKDKVALEY